MSHSTHLLQHCSSRFHQSNEIAWSWWVLFFEHPVRLQIAVSGSDSQMVRPAPQHAAPAAKRPAREVMPLAIDQQGCASVSMLPGGGSKPSSGDEVADDQGVVCDHFVDGHVRKVNRLPLPDRFGRAVPAQGCDVRINTVNSKDQTRSGREQRAHTGSTAPCTGGLASGRSQGDEPRGTTADAHVLFEEGDWMWWGVHRFRVATPVRTRSRCARRTLTSAPPRRQRRGRRRSRRRACLPCPSWAPS